MGQANWDWSQDKLDQAIEKLLEVIRIFPDYPQSYHRLGLIFEEKKELLKAAHYFTLYAQLNKNKEGNRDLWEYIGQIYYNA